MSAKNIVMAAAGAAGSGPVYVEDVFSTYLYKGIGTSQTINNGIALGNTLSSSLNGLPITIVSGNFANPYFINFINDDVIPTGNTGFSYADPGTYFDVYVDLLSPATVTAYKISPQGSAPSAVYNTITGFRVMASNNAVNWTTITTFSSISTGTANWTAGVLRTFSFSNSTAYRYWRLQGTSTTGSDGAGTSITEWQITGTATTVASGGMVWLKSSSYGTDHNLYNTDAGVRKYLKTNTTDAQATWVAGYGLTAFNTNGFTLGDDTSAENTSGQKYASWTFRKQPKFFDVVTWTGNGTNNRQISHALGSTPGFIIVKETNQTGAWYVYHTSNGTGKYMTLNNRNTVTTSATYFPAVSSTTFTPTSDTTLNTSSVTYVAYLFAHNAGGFGATGNDNIISCGSYTGNGSTNGPSINLGYEPQWLMIKRTDYDSGGGGWIIADIMRGMPAAGGSTSYWTNYLVSNSSAAENSASLSGKLVVPTPTGFSLVTNYGELNASGGNYIYVAIRRPMKTPTSGTQVYKGVIRSGVGYSPWVAINSGFPPDMTLMSARDTGNGANNTSYQNSIIDRVRRATEHIQTVNSVGEGGGWGQGHIHNMDGYDGLYVADSSYWAYSSHRFVDNHFKRAPGFLDIVNYTGTGFATAVSHGLTVTPELIFVKRRDTTGAWSVYAEPLGNTKVTFFDSAATINGFSYWNNTSPTSSVFTVNTNSDVNDTGGIYIAYLFASCLGVSKVGTYTGTGSPLTVNCGFTNGARFVLIKRTNGTGDWWFFDTARGMASGSSKALWLNTGGAAEVSGGYVYTTSVGFVVESSILALNTSGGTYMYLAIA